MLLNYVSLFLIFFVVLVIIVGIVVIHKLPGKVADCRLVYEVPSDIVELIVPFKLKDLPLP